jgi:hypothetical protein
VSLSTFFHLDTCLTQSSLHLFSTYPDIFYDYEPVVFVEGPFPTTFANGSTGCTDPAAGGTNTISLPSHPVSAVPGNLFPKGATLIPAWAYVVTQTTFPNLFPGFGPVECSVSAFSTIPPPAAGIVTAVAYLTKTSVSYLPTGARATQPPPPAASSSVQPSEPTQTEPDTSSPVDTATDTEAGLGPSAGVGGFPGAKTLIVSSPPNLASIGGPGESDSDTTDPPGLGATTVVVDSRTITGIQPTTAPVAVFTIFDSTVTAVAEGSAIVIGSQTLLPGVDNSVIFSGTPIPIAVSNSFIVVGTNTIPITQPVANSPLTTVFTVAGNAITAVSDGSSIVIAGQMLVPGGSPIIVLGTPISLAPSASYLVVGTSTIPLPSDPVAKVFTIGAETFIENSLSQLLVDGQTLVPGGPAIAVSGTPISLAPSASYLVVGSSTIPFSSDLVAKVLTIGTQTFTANSLSQFVIDGQTLVPGGPAITVSGTRISLEPGATAAVVGPSIETDAGRLSASVITTDSSDAITSVSGAAFTQNGPPIATGTSTKTGGAGSRGTAELTVVAISMTLALAVVYAI